MVLMMEEPGYHPGAGHRCVVGAHVRKALEVGMVSGEPTCDGRTA
jgi:hypothetical protein